MTTSLLLDNLLYFQWPKTCYWTGFFVVFLITYTWYWTVSHISNDHTRAIGPVFVFPTTTHLLLDSFSHFQWPHNWYLRVSVFPIPSQLLLDSFLYFQWPHIFYWTTYTRQLLVFSMNTHLLLKKKVFLIGQTCYWPTLVFPKTTHQLLVFPMTPHLLLDRFLYFQWQHAYYWTTER